MKRKNKELNNYRYVAGAGAGMILAGFTAMAFEPQFVTAIIGVVLLISAGLYVHAHER